MGLLWLSVICLISLSSATPVLEKSSEEGHYVRNPFSFHVTKKSVSIFKLLTDTESNDITVDKEPSLQLHFEEELGSPKWSSSCPEGSHCLQWENGGKVMGEMMINPFDNPLSTPDHKWEVVTNGPSHTYVMNYTGHYLYGGPLDYYYPSNSDLKLNAPSVTTEGSSMGVTLARNVAERVWAATNGRSVRVSDDTPLFFSQNQTTLLLTAKNELPYKTKKLTVSSLITVCLAANIKETWKCIQGFRPHPVSELRATEYPTLTTWVQYKESISQETVIDFVNQARNHGINISVIGIDTGWETCYGSQTFNKKFPDPRKMVMDLHQMGYQVTLWVHPFINLDCDAYDSLKDYLLRYNNGSIVNTTWWNGRGSMINFLDDAATMFYYNRLNKLKQDYGVDGFKFDAGESSYILEMNEAIDIDIPDQYTRNYIKMAAKFGSLGEVRVGAGTTYENIRMRLQDTNSVWDQHAGMTTVIPSMLQLGIIGYDAIIPDMVGGNEYGPRADKEMFIRWLQLSIFMPYYQFSIPPWRYDNETLKIAQDLEKLHYGYSLYMFDTLGQTDTQRPTIAPLWWIDPTDIRAQTCNDQFLLGDTILVAPVLQKGAVSRDIYFPSGVWLDESDGKKYTGPSVVKNFPAPLTKLPWFRWINRIY